MNFSVLFSIFSRFSFHQPAYALVLILQAAEKFSAQLHNETNFRNANCICDRNEAQTLWLMNFKLNWSARGILSKLALESFSAQFARWFSQKTAMIDVLIKSHSVINWFNIVPTPRKHHVRCQFRHSIMYTNSFRSLLTLKLLWH